MPLVARRLRLAVAVAAVSASAAGPASAQFPLDASLGWRTITTPHFRVHYEPGLEAWAQRVAARIEGYRDAVGARVGYVPPQVIDIIVEDPFTVPNGNAWPSLATPAMRFWATPPDPGSGLEQHRGWSEILGVHEYAHLAHLLRPTRDPWRARLQSLSPLPLGPIPTNAPAWVTEGYATVIEGELSGSGRPNSAGRAAFLRTLAREGAMPDYASLDAVSTYRGGAVRYLVGSAFLEWLQARTGDSSLVHLWRRMSARQQRSFDEAFTGVFGEAPAVLYDRFRAELTAGALAAERAVEAAGLARGGLRQRLAWYVGPPAVSPDGQKVALSHAVKGKAPVIVVRRTAPEARDSADSARLARVLARDPEDVAPVRPYPALPKVLATLAPRAGGAFVAPRWFADNDRLLVVHADPLPDGRSRPDVWIWQSGTGYTQRITHGAGIVEADPLPSGAQAAGIACRGGTCSVVLVDLVTGGVREVVAGRADEPFAGVRVSPDGSRVATALQQGGRWRPIVVTLATGAVQPVGPEDGVSRSQPAWANDSTLVVVSDAGGMLNLERLALAGGATTPMTRSLAAVSSPHVAPDGRTWFLEGHARGSEVRAIAADSLATAGAVALAPTLGAAVTQSATARAVAFADAPVAAAAAYGVGPLAVRPQTASTLGVDGGTASVGLSFGDPIGRLGGVLQVTLGDPGMWRGGGLGMAWRGSRPSLEVSAWSGEHQPSRQRTRWGQRTAGLDASSYQGGAAVLSLDRSTPHGGSAVRLVGTIGQLALVPSQSAARHAIGVGADAAYAWTPGGAVRIEQESRVTLTGGRTAAQSWTRWLADATVSVSPWEGPAFGMTATLGRVSGGAPAWEQFTYGGSAAPFVDARVLEQRIDAPAVPFAFARGDRLGRFRVFAGGTLKVFSEWFAAGSTLARYQQLAGVEASTSIPPIPVVRLPRLRLKAGLAAVREGRGWRRSNAYLSLVLQP